MLGGGGWPLIGSEKRSFLACFWQLCSYDYSWPWVLVTVMLPLQLAYSLMLSGDVIGSCFEGRGCMSCRERCFQEPLAHYSLRGSNGSSEQGLHSLALWLCHIPCDTLGRKKDSGLLLSRPLLPITGVGGDSWVEVKPNPWGLASFTSNTALRSPLDCSLHKLKELMLVEIQSSWAARILGLNLLGHGAEEVTSQALLLQP